MTESQYQVHVIRRLKNTFPGCTVLKNDSSYQQGIPDWSLFWRDKWGMLEIKAHQDAPIQPNQAYFIEKFNGESFAAFVYPENEEEVFRALQEAFAS